MIKRLVAAWLAFFSLLGIFLWLAAKIAIQGDHEAKLWCFLVLIPIAFLANWIEERE